MPGALQFQPDPILIRSARGMAAPVQDTVAGGAGTLLDVRQGEQLVYAAARARRHEMLSLVQLYKALAARMSGVNLEAASVEPDPERRKRMLTFVVVGGGFAGVETVGAINDLARQSLRHYGGIDPREVRVLLIHGGPVILPELGEALGLYAQEKLRKRQVEIKLKTKVIAYADGAVHCDDGEAAAADMLVWAGGVSPSPILKDTPFELQRGRVVVDSTLEVPRFPGVWAVGDCAAIIDPTSKHPYPPTAQHAVREGRRIPRGFRARRQIFRTYLFSH